MEDSLLGDHSDGGDSQAVHGVDRSCEQPGDQWKFDCRAEIHHSQRALNRRGSGVRRAIPL